MFIVVIAAVLIIYGASHYVRAGELYGMYIVVFGTIEDILKGSGLQEFEKKHQMKVFGGVVMHLFIAVAIQAAGVGLLVNEAMSAAAVCS